jgi:hypothetical protein
METAEKEKSPTLCVEKKITPMLSGTMEGVMQVTPFITMEKSL